MTCLFILIELETPKTAVLSFSSNARVASSIGEMLLKKISVLGAEKTGFGKSERVRLIFLVSFTPVTNE